MDAAPGTYWRDAPSSGSKLKRPEKSSELLLSEEVLDDLLDDFFVEDCLIGFLELEAVFAGCAELADEQAASVTSERRPIVKKRMFFINTLSNVLRRSGEVLLYNNQGMGQMATKNPLLLGEFLKDKR